MKLGIVADLSVPGTFISALYLGNQKLEFNQSLWEPLLVEEMCILSGCSCCIKLNMVMAL